MSLILRMLYVFLLSRRRERLPLLGARSTLRLRVLPNDLDANLHMNNGRFLTICDLNRVDLFIRSGLMKLMMREGWRPIIAEHTMKYLKPLKPFQRYEVVMEVERADERAFYMTHTFLVDGQVAAEGTSVGVVRRKGGVVPPDEVMARLAERSAPATDARTLRHP
jgi:acyl-CoA thioesterase FadM